MTRFFRFIEILPEEMASLERPLRFFPSCTFLNKALARSVIVLGKLMRSHIPEIVRKALIKVRSELLIVRRLLYLKKENKNCVKNLKNLKNHKNACHISDQKLQYQIKCMFSKKATKIDQIFSGEDFFNFCSLLRKHELWSQKYEC